MTVPYQVDETKVKRKDKRETRSRSSQLSKKRKHGVAANYNNDTCDSSRLQDATKQPLIALRKILRRVGSRVNRFYWNFSLAIRRVLSGEYPSTATLTRVTTLKDRRTPLVLCAQDNETRSFFLLFLLWRITIYSTRFR